MNICYLLTTQGATQPSNRQRSKMTERRRKKARLFTNDVKSLLYGFGDVENPNPETVNQLEDVLTQFIIDICHDASAFARVTRRQKIKVEDFKFALRKDPVKYGRVFELLELQKVITDARKQFDNSEGKSLKNLADDDEMNKNDEDGDDLDEPEPQFNEDGTLKVLPPKPKERSDKPKKKADEPERKKRKYTKSGKERKPYKKRAKKGEKAGAQPAARPINAPL